MSESNTLAFTDLMSLPAPRAAASLEKVERFIRLKRRELVGVSFLVFLFFAMFFLPPITSATELVIYMSALWLLPFTLGLVTTRARVKHAAWLLHNGDAHRAHIVKARRRLFGGRRYDIAWSDHGRERRARIRTGRNQRVDELVVTSTLRDDVVVVVTGDGCAYVCNCRA